MSSRDEEVFEQRRLRHITSIVIRNLEVPSLASTSTPSTSTLHRPRARRSVSIASSSSATTIRRASSIKGTPSKSRARASSIASTHKYGLGIDLDEHFDVDLADLRRHVEEKLCHTFITLSRIDDGREIVRTPPTSEAGIHFEWGRVPGSSWRSDGLPMFLLEGEDGVLDRIRVAVWWKRDWENGKGKAKDEDELERCVIERGLELQNGWSILWHRDVVLTKMKRLPDNAMNQGVVYGSNALVLGLSSSFTEISSGGAGKEISIRSADLAALKDRDKLELNERGGQTRYYIVRESKEGEGDIDSNGDALKPSAKDKAAIRAIPKDGTVVQGYDAGDILRLLQLQRELCALVREIRLSSFRSEKDLIGDDGLVSKEFTSAEREERLSILKQGKDSTREGAKAKKRLIQERIEAINRRKARLEIARRAMVKEKLQYQIVKDKLTLLQRQCESIRSKSYARRVVLLQQLEYIYPVELVDGATLLFSIIGVPLANRVVEDDSTSKQGEVDDTISSALGLVGQVVVLLSIYLDTPIHYSIITAGSRSIIQDSISIMSGPRAFPLYSKGVESYRFEYAIFLLNKDIEQLMNHFSITVLDIRNTLPNLKNLLVTMSASSLPQSRLSRRNLIGNETISLKSDIKRPPTPLQFINSIQQQQESSINGEKQAIARSTPAWGMSLLGWGSVKGHPTHSAHIMNSNTTTHLPTVRTLGGASS